MYTWQSNKMSRYVAMEQNNTFIVRYKQVACPPVVPDNHEAC